MAHQVTTFWGGVYRDSLLHSLFVLFLFLPYFSDTDMFLTDTFSLAQDR